MSTLAAGPADHCPQCKAAAEFLKVDGSMGELTCTNCGEVVESNLFDEGQEWRNFKQEGVDYGAAGNAHTRADVTDASEDGVALVEGTTMVGSDSASKRLQAFQRTTQQSSKALLTEDQALNQKLKGRMDRIREMGRRMGLDATIVNKCEGIFQELCTNKSLPDTASALWDCAMVHLASIKAKAFLPIPEIVDKNSKLLLGSDQPTPQNLGTLQKRVDDAMREIADAARPKPRAAGQDGKDQLPTNPAPAAREVDAKDPLITNPTPAAGDVVAAATPQLQQTTGQVNMRSNVTAAKRVGRVVIKKAMGLGLEDEAREELARRLLLRLNMSVEAFLPHVLKMVSNIYVSNIDKSKMPRNAIVTAAVFIVAWLSNIEPKPTFVTVGEVARLTSADVEETYYKIHPKLRFVVPQGLTVFLPVEKLPAPPESEQSQCLKKQRRS